MSDNVRVLDDSPLAGPIVKTFNDALELAAQDDMFAKALIANPASFREEYQLTDEQIAAICSAQDTAVLQYASDTSLGYEEDLDICT